MTRTGRENGGAGAAVWLIGGVCCLLPLGWMVLRIGLSPGMLVEAHISAFRLGLLGRTLAYNGAAALIASALAIPAAFVVGRGRGILARGVSLALPLSLLMPSMAFTYGWKQVFRLAGFTLFPQSAGDVSRCIWTLAAWLWPLPALGVGVWLRWLDPQLQQQALLDGALRRVTWRALRPAVLACFAAALVLAVQEFAVYEPTGISVVATEVRTVFDTGAVGSDWKAIAGAISGEEAPTADQAHRAAAALATALPLLAIIAVLFAMIWREARRAAAIGEVAGGNEWPAMLNTGRATTWLAVGVLLLTIATPLAALVLSLHRHRSPVMVWNTFSPYAWGSLLVGVGTGGAGVVLAAAASVRRPRYMFAASLMVFLVGGQLLAIALMRIYNRDAAPLRWIYDSAGIVILAHIGRFAWVGLLAGGATWSAPWRTLREAAAVDGASAMQTGGRVIWPLGWALLVGAGALMMLMSMTEVPATVMLPRFPQSLTPLLMGWVHMHRYDDMIEGSLLLATTTIVLGGGSIALVRLGMRAVRKGGSI